VGRLAHPAVLHRLGGGFGGANLRSFGIFAVTGVVLSIIITWVFNRTGESLPAAMLVHVSYNTFLSVASPALFPALGTLDRLTATIIGGGLFTVLIVAGTRGRLGYPAPAASPGLPPDHRG
jgi:membrane protease YdiL (CAAX protease family)